MVKIEMKDINNAVKANEQQNRNQLPKQNEKSLFQNIWNALVEVFISIGTFFSWVFCPPSKPLNFNPDASDTVSVENFKTRQKALIEAGNFDKAKKLALDFVRPVIDVSKLEAFLRMPATLTKLQELQLKIFIQYLEDLFTFCNKNDVSNIQAVKNELIRLIGVNSGMRDLYFETINGWYKANNNAQFTQLIAEIQKNSFNITKLFYE